MSGTSVDGIDISLVQTNGLSLRRLNKNYFYKYSNKTRSFLMGVLNQDINVNLKRKQYLDEFITNEYYLALKELNIIEMADIIGFHGQTIYHDPVKNTSIQLGDPTKLAKIFDKDVVFDFRSNDLKLGGQGAPLAPIYHKFIIEEFNLELPSCILNIGGVSNLTYWDGKRLLGFDIGPGNGLMDNYISVISNKHFDKKYKIWILNYDLQLILFKIRIIIKRKSWLGKYLLIRDIVNYKDELTNRNKVWIEFRKSELIDENKKYCDNLENINFLDKVKFKDCLEKNCKLNNSKCFEDVCKMKLIDDEVVDTGDRIYVNNKCYQQTKKDIPYL